MWGSSVYTIFLSPLPFLARLSSFDLPFPGLHVHTRADYLSFILAKTYLNYKMALKHVTKAMCRAVAERLLREWEHHPERGRIRPGEKEGHLWIAVPW